MVMKISSFLVAIFGLHLFMNLSIKFTMHLELIFICDISSMDEVTQTVFSTFGNNGIIQSAENHSCDECSQPFQAGSDVILNPNDPSALLGVDNPSAAKDIQSSFNNTTSPKSDSDMDMDVKNVTMGVVDGIVVGTKVFGSAICDNFLKTYFLSIVLMIIVHLT